jgi:hypothetical protein
MHRLMLLTICAALASVPTSVVTAQSASPQPQRIEIARSPKGELWWPRAGEPCDPSGRWLRLLKSGVDPIETDEASPWALDLQNPGPLVAGEPWAQPVDEAAVAPESIASSSFEEPELFPPPQIYVEDHEWVIGGTWHVRVEPRPNAQSERRIYLDSYRSGSKPRELGTLRGVRSTVRFDEARRCLLLCELESSGDDATTLLSWLPLYVAPPAGEPVWFEDDEAAALSRAQAGDRLVFAHFRIPRRALAEFMETRALGDDRVRAELARIYVPLKMDAQQARERFAALFGERGALGSAILSANGETVAILKGFAEPDALLYFLEGGEGLYSDWQYRRCESKENPLDDRARLEFALCRLRGDDVLGAEQLLLELMLSKDQILRARALVELAALELERGHVQESLLYLSAFRAIEYAFPPSSGSRFEFEHRARLTRADLTEAMLARARRKAAHAARVLEISVVSDPGGANLERRLLELSLAWHEEGQEKLGERGLRTILSRYPGWPIADQAAACLQHMNTPHGH